MILSARLRRVPYVFALLAGCAIALVGCTTYDDIPLGEQTEDGSSDHRDQDASVSGCTGSGDDVCDDAFRRSDGLTGDASPSDSTGVPDGARSDLANEPRPFDVRSDSVDESTPADASGADVDVEADASSDVGETGAVDASSGDTARADASDVETGTADVSDARSVDVSDVAPPPTFYRAINVGDSQATALVIDGQNWEAGLTAPNVTYAGGTDAAGSGGLARVTNVPLIPSTDANRTSMIQTFAWGRPIAFSMTGVPTGRYLVYMYTWEDNGAQTFDILLQGQVVLASYNSGANGHWDRLGPWTVDVSAGTIAIATQPTTGAAFANLCGVEVWRQ